MNLILFPKVMYLWIGRNCHSNFLTQVLGVPNYAAVPDNLVGFLTLGQLLYLCNKTSQNMQHSYISICWRLPLLADNKNCCCPLTVFAPRTGHCRVSENQSFHWLAERSEAIFPLPAYHQVGPHWVLEKNELSCKSKKCAPWWSR